MVCSLVWADDNHYPTAKAVSDAMACAWVWDMLSSIYDPCEKKTNAFDYCNFINTPNLCAVATSGKYCDLTGTPSIPAALTAWCGTTISSNKINVNYDWTTIKKNSWNCLYADYSGLATTAQLDCKADASSLCTVATSGEYCDLTGAPSLCTVATTWCYNDLTWKPTLCTVATSGKYCDLSWKPNLCVVATSWKYCDLTWTPTIPDVNTKTFTLSSTGDITNATAALAYINWWWNALVIYNWAVYTLYSSSSSSVVFKSSLNTSGWNTYSTIQQATLTFTVSDDAVTAITASNASLGKYLETDRNYTTPFTPTCNWHPATKKYVDDAVWAINSAEWWCITWTLSCQIDLQTVLNNKLGSSNCTYCNVIYLSQSDYDSLTTKDPNTLYSTPEWDSPVVTYVNWCTGSVTVQPTLVSWTNIKTVKSTSLLGNWDISINEVPSSWATWHVLTKTANWYCWAAPAETGITNDTTCTTSALQKIWVWTQEEYESISTYCDTTAYLVF